MPLEIYESVILDMKPSNQFSNNSTFKQFLVLKRKIKFLRFFNSTFTLNI